MSVFIEQLGNNPCRRHKVCEESALRAGRGESSSEFQDRNKKNVIFSKLSRIINRMQLITILY